MLLEKRFTSEKLNKDNDLMDPISFLKYHEMGGLPETWPWCKMTWTGIGAPPARFMRVVFFEDMENLYRLTWETPKDHET